MGSSQAESIEELRAREDEVAREWEWLHETVNRVARANSENESADAFRLLQHQAMAVGQRRVELRLRMAALEGDEQLVSKARKSDGQPGSARYRWGDAP